MSIGLDEDKIEETELVATKVLTQGIQETLEAQNIAIDVSKGKNVMASITSLSGRLPVYQVVKHGRLVCMKF